MFRKFLMAATAGLTLTAIALGPTLAFADDSSDDVTEDLGAINSSQHLDLSQLRMDLQNLVDLTMPNNQVMVQSASGAGPTSIQAIITGPDGNAATTTALDSTFLRRLVAGAPANMQVAAMHYQDTIQQDLANVTTDAQASAANGITGPMQPTGDLQAQDSF